MSDSQDIARRCAESTADLDQIGVCDGQRIQLSRKLFPSPAVRVLDGAFPPRILPVGELWTSIEGDGARAKSGLDATVNGGVSSAADLEGLLAGGLLAEHAVIVKVNSGSLNGRTLLVVDADGVDGYTAGTDFVPAACPFLSWCRQSS